MRNNPFPGCFVYGRGRGEHCRNCRSRFLTIFRKRQDSIVSCLAGPVRNYVCTRVRAYTRSNAHRRQTRYCVIFRFIRQIKKKITTSTRLRVTGFERDNRGFLRTSRSRTWNTRPRCWCTSFLRFCTPDWQTPAPQQRTMCYWYGIACDTRKHTRTIVVKIIVKNKNKTKPAIKIATFDFFLTSDSTAYST